MTEEFIEAIDKAVKRSGFSDRAKFMRAAIAEKCQAMGLEVPPEYHSAPSRTGKGGHRRGGTSFVSPSSSRLASVAAEVSKKHEALELHQSPKSQPSIEAASPSAHKPRPLRGTSKRSKDKPSPPGQAPK